MMRNLFLFLMIFWFCFYSSTVLAGKVFKWKDDQGRIHFTDNEQNIPREVREQLVELEFKQKDTAKSQEIDPVEKPSIKNEIAEQQNEKISVPFVASEGMASRIIVDVKFNNKITVPMLVDTGAPGVIISDKLASQLGLFDDKRSNLMVSVSGIGGEQAAFRTIIDKITIGGITEEFVPTHIVSSLSDSFDGLIGMTILSSYNITIDSINNKLIFIPNPAANDLPAGRGKLWWQRTFREFRFHKEFWENQAELVKRGKGPYSRMTSSRAEMYQDAINYQARVAQDLYQKLTRFAGWRVVPNEWRK